MTIYTHSVYWIHFSDHTDSYLEGYIGVSKDPETRLYQHFNTSEKRNDKNPYFGRILNKYKEKIIQTILYVGTEESCYNLEEEMRPSNNIGWNANKGGTHPPSKKGWKPSDDTLRKRSIGLKDIPRTDEWNNKISIANSGEKNGMFGRKEPCSLDRKISIIVSKNIGRIEQLTLVFSMLNIGEKIRDISKHTGYSTGTICKMKKESHLYYAAFPTLIEFKRS
jgi:hypothetical protein